MSQRDEPVTARGMERHVTTVLVMVVVAILLWIGATVSKTQVSVAEMRVQIAFMQAQMAEPHNHPSLMQEMNSLRQEFTNHIEQCRDRE